MLAIWKYQIRPNASRDKPYECHITAPAGARAVHVGIQNGKCCVWCEVNPNNEPCTIRLYSVGTGFGNVPHDARFVGTIVNTEEGFVWHIYQSQ